jgi:hypothetical protein
MRLLDKAMKFLGLRKIRRGEVSSVPNYLSELTGDDPAPWAGLEEYAPQQRVSNAKVEVDGPITKREIAWVTYGFLKAKHEVVCLARCRKSGRVMASPLDLHPTGWERGPRPSVQRSQRVDHAGK